MTNLDSNFNDQAGDKIYRIIAWICIYVIHSKFWHTYRYSNYIKV